MNEKTSVLISLYNAENADYYRECLKSISVQTLLADEVTVVYDGPIRKELDDVTDFYRKKLNIKLVKLSENAGLGLALREGLIACSYNVIFRMDTDDVCDENRFNIQYKYMQENPNVDIVGMDIIEQDIDTGSVRKKSLPASNEEIKKYSRIKNPINHMAVCFRKDRILCVGSYVHHQYMEDYNLWLRCIKKGYNINNINVVGVKARVGSGMINKRKGIRYVKSELKLFRLKNDCLDINLFLSIFIFSIRILPRILPSKFLRYLYKRDRKSC